MAIQAKICNNRIIRENITTNSSKKMATMMKRTLTTISDSKMKRKSTTIKRMIINLMDRTTVKFIKTKKAMEKMLRVVTSMLLSNKRLKVKKNKNRKMMVSTMKKKIMNRILKPDNKKENSNSKRKLSCITINYSKDASLSGLYPCSS